MFCNSSIVSVELGATETSPGRSPTKVYTPLEVVSLEPQTSIPGPSTSDLPRSSEEKILVPKTAFGEGAGICPTIPHDDSSVIALHQSCEGTELFVEQPPEVTQPDLHQTQACKTTHPTMMTLQE